MSDEIEIRKEIKELEKERDKLLAKAKEQGKGKKGFFGKARVTLEFGGRINALNKAIKERKQFFSNKSKLRLLKQKKELAETRADLKKAIKPITSEDIFGGMGF